MLTTDQPLKDYHDLAEVLTEQFNGLANASEDFYPINQDFVYECLHKMFEPGDIEYMIDDDFSRGVIMGIIYTNALLQTPDDEETTDGEHT
jgi:hypothetical protein